MCTEDSVTTWLNQLKEGQTGVPQEKMVARFLQQLTMLARRRLRNLRAYEDEHDIALSAMNSFLMRVPGEGFGKLDDRNSLWALLVAITVRKVAAVQRRQFAAKRDVRRAQSLDAVVRAEPSNEFLDSVIDEGNQLLETITDDVSRKIVRMRLEGYTNQEIAESIDRSVKTVERKLNIIRTELREALDSCDE